VAGVLGGAHAGTLAVSGERSGHVIAALGLGSRGFHADALKLLLDTVQFALMTAGCCAYRYVPNTHCAGAMRWQLCS
jgi:hypothetical protein